MNKSKITKTQEYAILWLASKNYTSVEIAKELKVSADNVERLISINKEPTMSKSAEKSMITHTAGKKINSVAIMTQTASEIGDENRKNLIAQRDNHKNIFRPKQ